MSKRLTDVTIGATSFLLGVAVAKLLPSLIHGDDDRPTIRVRSGSLDVEIDHGDFKGEDEVNGKSDRWRVKGGGEDSFEVRATGHPKLTGKEVTLYFTDASDTDHKLVVLNDQGRARLTFPDLVGQVPKRRKKRALVLTTQGLTKFAYSVDASPPRSLDTPEWVVEID